MFGFCVSYKRAILESHNHNNILDTVETEACWCGCRIARTKLDWVCFAGFWMLFGFRLNDCTIEKRNATRGVPQTVALSMNKCCIHLPIQLVIFWHERIRFSPLLFFHITNWSDTPFDCSHPFTQHATREQSSTCVTYDKDDDADDDDTMNPRIFSQSYGNRFTYADDLYQGLSFCVVNKRNKNLLNASRQQQLQRGARRKIFAFSSFAVCLVFGGKCEWIWYTRIHSMRGKRGRKFAQCGKVRNWNGYKVHCIIWGIISNIIRDQTGCPGVLCRLASAWISPIDEKQRMPNSNDSFFSTLHFAFSLSSPSIQSHYSMLLSSQPYKHHFVIIKARKRNWKTGWQLQLSAFGTFAHFTR